MSLPDKIIRTLKQMDRPSDFQIYRDILAERPKLPPVEWHDLCRLVKTSKIYNILRLDLSRKEAEVLGSALKKVSLNHVNDMIDILVKKRDENTPVLLRYLLEKKKKISTDAVQRYFCEEINRPVTLKHLKLLHVMCKNYPASINSTILDFCRSNGHPICKDVLNSAMDVIE
ncbi:putative essential nuclear protein 1 [Encephalitozoon hellem]|uniref:Essential nuclear protein 1 n=1 Tax=Encephalitozoon hellem TaxID=27973 RepID=A0ABY8CQJ5_ENCHE|nr:putative essential nuclear protein 1 [Encephalitozoon hellem]